MTASALLPTLLKPCKASLRLCWRTLRALLLLFVGLLLVAWMVLHWAILPRANELRPWLEREARHALGVDLRIGSLGLSSGGWMPGLELIDVRLLDPAGREALRLPRVAAVLSAQSLLVLEPRFSQLLIDSPELEVRRDRQGRVFVAGLDVQGAEKAEASGAADAWMDWLFSQPELAVLKARIRWVDERRAAPPLELDDLNLVLRNGLRRHLLRLDATPPAAWGQRFSLRGRFTQDLLQRPGDLNHWRGQLFADLPRADLHELRRHVDLPFELAEGDGALRAWVEVQAGLPSSATLDLALRAVRLRLLDGAPELTLDRIEGRLDLARTADKLSLQAQRLGFVSGDGVVWPRSDWGVSLQLKANAGATEVVGGQANAQRLDFALLSQIAQRLPLGDKAHQLLASLQPQGVLGNLKAEWQGALDAPKHYRVQAQLEGLALAAEAHATDPQHLGRPGVRGANFQIDANERGGQALLTVKEGEVELPGLFEEPVLPITQLSTRLSWKLPAPGDKKPEVEIRLADLQLQTPDTSGELDVTWHRAVTPGGAGSTGSTAGPGHIDLTGKLSGLAATRVARYMPQGLPATRSYLSRALLAGRAKGVSLRLKGNLAEFPFASPGNTGVFRVVTQAEGVTLAYVPAPPEGGPLRWPAFEAIDGELVFDRAGMQLRGVRGKALGYEVYGVNGGIADLGHHRVLELDGNGRGQVADLLRFVRASPLDEWLGHGLSPAVANGPAALKLALNIPLQDVNAGKLKGQLQLDGIDLKLRPDVPALANARARIDFDEHTVQVHNGTARALGGEAQIDGGSQPGGSLRFGVQGQASAEALRRATELGALSQLAQAMTGQAAYRFQLAIAGGQSEVSLASNLQGLALDLPAPLKKEPDTALPLRWLQVPTAAGRDEIRLELGPPAAPLLAAQLQRDTSGSASRVLRGAFAVQDKLPPLPPTGVALQANVASLDLDAWQARLKQLGSGHEAAVDVAHGGSDTGWLPHHIGLKAQTLKLDGRQLDKLSATISRNPDASQWRFQVEAEQLAGSFELRGVKGEQVGEVQARLSRLSLPRQEAEVMSERASALLDRPDAHVPALDIVVEDFELRGKRLGRLEVLGKLPSGSRDWRLDKLLIQSPDATLTASGAWAAAPTPGQRRRTELDTKLEIVDAGKLLERLVQGQVLRSGKGTLEGHISWDGSPLAFNYNSLAGQLNLKLDAGAFLKADPGVGRLLGVLSLQSLPRRFLLDFRDVFAEGFTFDGVTGDVKIASGIATSDNMRIRGVQASVLVEGRTDLAAETQDLRVVVVPEVNAGGASLAYAAVNPAIALGTFLAQLILSRPMSAAGTREFHITGTWEDPKVEKVEKPEGAPAKAGSAP